MIEIGIEVSRDAICGIISDPSDIFTISWIFSITLKPYSVVLKTEEVRNEFYIRNLYEKNNPKLQESSIPFRLSSMNTHKLRFAILYIFVEGCFDCLR